MGASILHFPEGRLGLLLGKLLSGVGQLSVSDFPQVNLGCEFSSVNYLE